MRDRGRIATGLALFVGLVTLPIWFNAASGTTARALQIEQARGERCVLETERMRAEHMDLLARWRDDVVRRQQRVEVTADGRRIRRSLVDGCLGCHESKRKSCDRCHAFLGVTPYCWDCHVAPTEQEP
ncbi:MAG: sulfate reduction electron transfer complex DsrMKJOP subunit DsrJ [Acidobacteriota bacterium]